MISVYASVIWWLLPPGLVLWWMRRWLLTPWARYVSHSKSEKAGCFLTVRHVHWWPPFLDYECIYHRNNLYGSWRAEGTGCTVDHEYDLRLTNMIVTAEARIAETEELAR